MRKTMMYAIVVALIAACGAQAAVGLAERFEIGAANSVHWMGGIGSANGLNQISANHRQDTFDARQNISGIQRERASLRQSGMVSGSGPGAVRQYTDAKGLQRLFAEDGPTFTSRGLQRLGVEMGMATRVPYGLGSAEGSQRFGANQRQIIETPFSITRQSQRMNVRQLSSIDAQADMDPLVRSRLNVRLDQRAFDSGPPQAEPMVSAP